MENASTVVSMDQTKFEKNTAVPANGYMSYGGGLQLIGHSLTCTLANGVEFLQNQAQQGGAISAIKGASIAADSITIRENVAHNGTGGGIHFEVSPWKVARCQLYPFFCPELSTHKTGRFSRSICTELFYKERFIVKLQLVLAFPCWCHTS